MQVCDPCGWLHFLAVLQMYCTSTIQVSYYFQKANSSLEMNMYSDALNNIANKLLAAATSHDTIQGH
jgi:hypothetical protein